MLPGPILIIECPFCSTLIKLRTLASGNTFGATRWSDGKLDAPMLKERPELAKCKKCGHFYFIKNARIIEELDWFSDEAQNARLGLVYADLDFIKFPTLKQYLRSLDEIKDDHTYIRLQIWRLYNNNYRRNRNKQLSDAAQLIYDENAAQLIKLLRGNTEEDKILKTELYRNLGKFDQSQKLLERISTEYDDIKAALLKEILLKNKRTIKLPDPKNISDSLVLKKNAGGIYLLDCHIVGTYYQNVSDIFSDLITGEKLTLKREPDNKFDNSAIAVYSHANIKLGYIPKAKNEILARLSDGGKLIYFARLDSKDNDNGYINLQISIHFAVTA